MMPSGLDIKARLAELAELAEMNALLVVGVKEHGEQRKMQVRIVAMADDPTSSEMRHFARILAALGMGLKVVGPQDLQGEADRLLGLAKSLHDMAKEKAQA